MAFLNPLLLFGIIGIAAPIIIHLLAKKRIKRTLWAAMKFLKIVVEKNQRRLTLEDLILLILRCLVLIALALAMARPSFKPGGFGGFGGSNEAAIILLDNSASMSQSDGAASKFDKAQKAAEEALDALPSGSSVAVWLVSDVVKNVIPEPTRDFALARKVIRAAQRSDRGTELPAALRQAVEFMQRQTTAVKQIFLLTDGQAAGWKQLADTRLLLDSVKKDIQTRLVLVGESEQHNLGVTGLRMSSALAPVTQPVRYEVALAKYGVEESRNVPASATIAQIEKRRQKILDTQIDPAVYAELTERVEQEKEVALQALDAAKAAGEKVIADREELERLRAEDAKRREREAEEARQRVAEEEARIAREFAEQDRQRAIKVAEENASRAAEAKAEAQRQATEAELRRKAQAEVDAANARAAEAERLREEMANRERAADAARQAQAEEDERRRKDQEHRATIFEQAAQDMTGVSGITMAAAKKLVQAIAAGSIRNVTVEF